MYDPKDPYRYSNQGMPSTQQQQNYYGGGGGYQIPGLDPTKSPIGRGEFDQDMLAQLMQLNPQLAAMYQQSQQGFDPTVQSQLNNLPGLQNQILNGGYFGNEQADVYKNLINGTTLSSQSGDLYKMIQDQFAPARNETRGYAASMGLNPASGEAMSAMGNQLGAQDTSFTNAMLNNYMNMVNTGTSGLNTMGNEQLNRQQAAGGLGQWLSQFVTGQQNTQTQMGTDITNAQMSPFMQLLGLSQQNQLGMQQNKGPNALQTGLSAFGAVAPFLL
jgi:hypothetical protein